MKQYRNTGYIVYSDGKIVSPAGKVLVQTVLQVGYKAVSLSVKGKVKKLYVHRLVAECYLGAIPLGQIVHHKDHNKLNNHVNNLEITTRPNNAKEWRKTTSHKSRVVKTGCCLRGHDKQGKRKCPTCAVNTYKPDSSLIWKPFKDKWLISYCGKAWSLCHKRIMSPGNNVSGYLYLNLDGKNISVHRLVYKLHIGDIPQSYVVHHKDGNRHNNHADNLEAITHSENSQKIWDS